MNPVELVLLRPIVEGGRARPVMVSWRLMSGADSEHVWGSWEQGGSENAGLICKGNGVDIKQNLQSRPVSVVRWGQNARPTLKVDLGSHHRNEIRKKPFVLGQNPTQHIQNG